MDDFLPLIIACGVGACGCIVYVLALFVVAVYRRFGGIKEEFELDEDVLVVDIRCKPNRNK